MEKAFLEAWKKCREQAAAAGVRMRPVEDGDAMKAAHRALPALAKIRHLEWSLEALAVDRRFTALFTDEEANEALRRLMEAGYFAL